MGCAAISVTVRPQKFCIPCGEMRLQKDSRVAQLLLCESLSL